MIRSIAIAAALLLCAASGACKTAYGEQQQKVRDVSAEGSTHKLAKPGFVVFDADKEGRIWVFRQDAKELVEFTKNHELAKCVTVPAGGPEGRTVKAPDRDTIDAFTKAWGM